MRSDMQHGGLHMIFGAELGKAMPSQISCDCFEVATKMSESLKSGPFAA